MKRFIVPFLKHKEETLKELLQTLMNNEEWPIYIVKQSTEQDFCLATCFNVAVEMWAGEEDVLVFMDYDSRFEIRASDFMKQGGFFAEFGFPTLAELKDDFLETFDPILQDSDPPQFKGAWDPVHLKDYMPGIPMLEFKSYTVENETNNEIEEARIVEASTKSTFANHEHECS